MYISIPVLILILILIFGGEEGTQLLMGVGIICALGRVLKRIGIGLLVLIGSF